LSSSVKKVAVSKIYQDLRDVTMAFIIPYLKNHQFVEAKQTVLCLQQSFGFHWKTSVFGLVTGLCFLMPSAYHLLTIARSVKRALRKLTRKRSEKIECRQFAKWLENGF
jgi:hypothetical protein